MNEQLRKEVMESVERTRENLRQLTKTLPKFAYENPDLYRRYGLDKELKKVRETYIPQ